MDGEALVWRRNGSIESEAGLWDKRRQRRVRLVKDSPVMLAGASGRQTNESVVSVMHPANPAPAARFLFALASIVALGACATTRLVRREERVTLVKPFETASTSNLPPFLALKYAELAKIDPDHPLADDRASQTLSLFGREDLISAISHDYKSNHCAPLKTSLNVFDAIESGARKTSIVIINESHERSQHRGFTAEIARRLRPLGYDTMAIETLSNSSPGTPERYLPTFRKRPDLPYFVDEDGFYLSEAGFGRLGRQAKALGYRLLPYEIIGKGGTASGATRDQQIATREEGQARNLTAYLRDHPGAKLLIHVGYSHAAEVPRPNGEKWMAMRLKEKTGIDPLTISQTSCRGGGDTDRLAALPADEPMGTFDLLVDHPNARFAQGRPEWRMLAGDRPVGIPQVLRPAVGWRVIEARPVGEPVTSVPMDRVAIRPRENIALMLPPGSYHLRVIDPAGAK